MPEPGPAQTPELYAPEVIGCSVAAAALPAAVAACGPIVTFTPPSTPPTNWASESSGNPV